MLIDEVSIIVKAGKGGNGSASFRRNAQTAKGGPDGGNGGNGGNLYFQGADDITLLSQFQFKKKLSAEDGIPGAKKNLYGRNGKDLVIPVPLGTLVTDETTGRNFEVANTDKILIAKGGKGGRGNNEFKTATNQTPLYAEKGEPGEERKLHLVLKLIADVGLIGLPNAGKSSLLAALTNAKPKIGNYAFTTLEPNLGVMQGIVLADIPGLIEGASQGKGLGVKFLKHIEKTKLLIHCIDATTENVNQTYETVRKEFEAYSKALLEKQEIILLTKIDLVSAAELKIKMAELKSIGEPIYPISLYQEDTIEKLRTLILTTTKKN